MQETFKSQSNKIELNNKPQVAKATEVKQAYYNVDKSRHKSNTEKKPKSHRKIVSMELVKVLSR